MRSAWPSASRRRSSCVQAQRDLARAKQSELNATIDYNRSLVDFEAVQISPIGGGQ